MLLSRNWNYHFHIPQQHIKCTKIFFMPGVHDQNTYQSYSRTQKTEHSVCSPMNTTDPNAFSTDIKWDIIKTIKQLKLMESDKNGDTEFLKARSIKSTSRDSKIPKSELGIMKHSTLQMWLNIILSFQNFSQQDDNWQTTHLPTYSYSSKIFWLYS